MPSAFIVGLKPTSVQVSTFGFLYCNRSFDLSTAFALTTKDAFVVQDAIKGHDARDIQSVSVSDGYAIEAGKNFRFAVQSIDTLEYFGDFPDEQQFKEALVRLLEIGGRPLKSISRRFWTTHHAGLVAVGRSTTAEMGMIYDTTTN